MANAPPTPSWWQRQRAQWRESFGNTPSTTAELELVQRRIYVLPSMRGWAVIGIAILLLLMGVNYQLSLAYVVAFLLGGLMQVALHATYRNLRGLIVKVGKSPRCIAGETLQFPITLASPDRAREGITIERLLRKQKRVVGSAQCLRIASDQQRSHPLDVATTQRGVQPLGRLLIESRAPYGLIRAWSYAHFEWVGLVEPRPETPYPELPYATGSLDAAKRQSDVAHDPDMLREYVAGDSLKRVAWKQVAKSGQWYTRTGEAGQRGDVELSWLATDLTDAEARLSRMAAWIDRARNADVAFSLVMPNAHLTLASTAPHHDEALAVLATFPKPLSEVRGVRT
ncbi:MAG: DUF58 domain-containing protein [Burkholderiales bacterium]|nr:MAG: DUF58 domain-containing protein [Betaproteobacteria bacterium]TAG68811.1 MAG: DUF58 domain-containing protein [Burkholderiales bacterium]